MAIVSRIIYSYIIAYSLEDIERCNWICRVSWTSEKLDPAHIPNVLSSAEIYPNGIRIDWNSEYKMYSEYYLSHTMTKEDFLERLDNLLSLIHNIVKQLFKLNEAYFNNNVSEEDYVKQMRLLEEKLTPLYFDSSDLGYAPFECQDLSQQFQNAMATSHNIVLPFSKIGAQTWEKAQQDRYIQVTLKDCQKEWMKLQFEYEKICGYWEY